MIGALYAADGSAADVVEAVAREFSPRIERCGTREITLDLSGLERLFGDARTIAEELRRTAADRGLRVRVAIAGTRTAARLLVRHRAGLTVIDPGTEADALAPLPIELLAALNDSNEKTDPNDSHELVRTFRRWGIRTCGELAALPADDVAARLGQVAVKWQYLARGDDPRPLVPAVPAERFAQTLELEWPIDGLEPLSFVLGRLLEPLEAHLERRDRGAAVLHVHLRLVTREVHTRSLELPAAIRDARTLRTLALLDLESHPPSAAIDGVTVAVDPTPGRVVQYSLLTRPLPSPEQISTLMARLTALMGEGRCGSPEAVDSWRPGAFAMRPFTPRDSPLHESGGEAARPLAVALRRFRFPVPARVHLESDKPCRVTTDRRGFAGGRVQTCSGPWRTSGAWWEEGLATPPKPGLAAPTPGLAAPKPKAEAGGWDRDEWDVALPDGTYRIFRERASDRWFIDAIVD